MKNISLALVLWLVALAGAAQPVAVTKTNPQPVYMHYMPWFETPQTNGGAWGLHWTMANQNPNVVDPATGQRQIASHYYPLIGPYASSDPDVIEYHLLLMKYAGVDGVLLDYYGDGANDLPLLLRNTNALVARTPAVGIGFGVVFEDQFAATLSQATANMKYVGDNYFSKSTYIKLKNKPLLLAFGPQKYKAASDWPQILGALPTAPEFLPLWYQSGDVGSTATGEFSWIYSDYLTGLRYFDGTRAATLGTAGGVAYPGFDSFYAQGGWAGPTWTIPLNGGQTLAATLALATQYQNKLAFVQLATFNDFGEGTMLEPTKEFGFTLLEQVQKFTGVPYTVKELQLIYQLYTLRKSQAGNATAQATLDQAFQKLVALQVPAATALLNGVTPLAAAAPAALRPALALYPNPATGLLHLAGPAFGASGTVQVYNALGQVVLTTAAQPDLDVSALPSGSYWLHYRAGDTQLSGRFVK